MKSFCGEVKEELEKIIPVRTHCLKAELAGYVLFAPKKFIDKSDSPVLKSLSDSLGGICPEEILSGTTGNGERCAEGIRALLKKTCCKRSFVRGAFLAAGSISDPGDSYHLEIVGMRKEDFETVNEALSEFDISGKLSFRGNRYVLYISDSEKISDVLNVMEAHVALMNFENARIVKELRNNVNRRVNCETSNLRKTVDASGRQCECIDRLIRNNAFETLPDTLREIATLRMENPDASLAELGRKLNPVLGRSGVNHRLEKICMIADELKRKEEENGQK